MNDTLKYCECPEPVVTDQQFCDQCGAEYQATPPIYRDRLAAGERIGEYQVAERQRMWAVLENAEGLRFRFWPTGDTTAKATDEVRQALAASEIDESSVEHQDGQSTVEVEVTAQEPPSEQASENTELQPALPANTSDIGVHSVEVPDSQVTEASVAREENLSEGGSDTPELSVTSEHVAVTEDPTSLPQTPVASASADPVPLRHFTFLQARAAKLDGIPGYLEPERPDKFTGTEIRSLRSLMEADPSGEDMQPTRLLGWLIQCAQAMKSAHEQGILVNSFTPETVFIDFDPAASKAERITISTCLHAAPFDTAHPVAGYAPQGDEPLSQRTDVYQVGALLRDLLGWRTDQVWGEDTEVLLRQPMPLVRLVLQLMHPDPEKRPDGAEALKKVLVETQQAFVTQHVLDVAGVTDMGLNREHNEDAFGFLQFEENAGRGQLSSTVLVVCDGVGGTNAGEEASRMAVHQVLATLAASAGTSLSVPKRLEDAVLQANAKLLDLSRQHRGAGCTIVTVYIRGQEYWVAHAGDSRAYVCVDGILRSLTADHSWTAQQVRKGLLTLEEAKNHENAHMIYRSLGERDRLEVEVQPTTDAGTPLEPGSVFLLCTDGVTDVLEDDQLQSILSSNIRSPRDKARHCVQAANSAGGPDNITALVAVQEATL